MFRSLSHTHTHPTHPLFVRYSREAQSAYNLKIKLKEYNNLILQILNVHNQNIRNWLDQNKQQYQKQKLII